MNDTNDMTPNYDVGHEIGMAAATHGEHHADQVCTHERQRIELTNEPKIRTLKAKLFFLQKRERDLETRISKAVPAHEAHTRKRRVAFYWALAMLLCVAGFALALIAFDPFRWGWKAWPFCLGLAVVTPFLLDRVLQAWESRNLLRALCTMGCLAAVTSAMLLAVIRGDLFREQMKDENPVVVMTEDAPPITTSAAPDGAAAPPPTSPAGDNFYERTAGLLDIVMALAALAMELGAGFATHEAKRWSSSTEDAAALRQELDSVHGDMIGHGEMLWRLQNEGVIFEKRFYRDFYYALFTRAVRSAIRKLSLIALAASLLLGSNLHALDCEDVVVLLDLSQSVAFKGYSGETEFQKNIAGVSRVVSSLPAGSNVTVFGITDDSFGKPYQLLQAQLSSDEGYFKERLAHGRAELLRAWQMRARNLKPEFPQTDILGALLLASQHFEQTRRGCQRVLVIFSDMRQATSVLNLERPQHIDSAAPLEAIVSNGLGANLHGIEVSVFGADAAGATVSYWQGLRTFWEAYFKNAGASVIDYSVLRAPPR